MHADDIDEIVGLTPALRRYARVLTRYNIEESDDLVQDTLERAFASGDRQYRHGTNLKAWLMRILHNRFLDVRRKNSTRSQHLQSLKQEDAIPRYSPHAVDVAEARELVAAFEELPEIYRRSLFLVAVEQTSYEEAAEILEVPVGTVKSRVARARDTLKKAIGLTTDGSEEELSPTLSSSVSDIAKGSTPAAHAV